MDGFLLVFEILGTIAFAVSGAMTGLKKRMDLFGVVILGLTTAVGGGIIRDLILGLTPPTTFQNPVYALIALATAAIVFIPVVRRGLTRNARVYETCLLWMDSVGLGVFTVMGIFIARSAQQSCGAFLLIFVGVITGVGGGVVRDMMAGMTPYIFVKHIYACASVVGAALCVALWPYLGQTVSMLCGMAVTVALRVLSAHFRWNLPRAAGVGA